MLVLFVRALLLYTLVFFVIRMTGKRQLSDLQPFDLVITLLIADLASEPASNTGIPLIYGIVPILALFLLQQLIAFLSMKSEKVRNVVCGKPIILISHGIVDEASLRTAKYTLADLMEQLRSKDVFTLSDVEFAILETNGDLSALLKGGKQTVTYEALSLPLPASKPPLAFLLDGVVHHGALRQSGYDLNWLTKQLAKVGLSCKDSFFALLNSDGTLHVQAKESARQKCRFYMISTSSQGKNND